MLVLIIVTGRQQLRIDIQHLRAHLSQFGLLLLAAVLISINWFTYIWAVTNQHVLDTSLGYYINPLTQRIARYFNLQRILAVATKTKYRHCNLGRGYHDCSTRYIAHCLYRPSRIL